jgi:hypothetical protein
MHPVREIQWYEKLTDYEWEYIVQWSFDQETIKILAERQAYKFRNKRRLIVTERIALYLLVVAILTIHLTN